MMDAKGDGTWVLFSLSKSAQAAAKTAATWRNRLAECGGSVEVVEVTR
jgi:hypothetical protein